MVMNLTAETVHVITGALAVAAERYKEDAIVCRTAGHVRLAEQFDKQERDARTALNTFERFESLPCW